MRNRWEAVLSFEGGSEGSVLTNWQGISYFTKGFVILIQEHKIQVMDLQLEKRLLIERLKSVEDAGLIRAIMTLLDKKLGKEEDEMTLRDYNRDISLAEEEIGAGYGVDHEDVVNESKSW